MKSLAAIAAASTVSASVGDDAMNALHIKVSPFGQKRIEKEGMDVHRVAHKIQNAPATKSLKGALKKWAHSRAAHNVHKLDKKFIASPAGKRLIKEWKDVGRVLKNNVHETPNGVHFNNGAMHKLSKELDDVSDHYEYIGTTHWAKKYDRAYKHLFTNKAFNKVKFAAKNFKHSPAGKMLGKEVREFGQALKTHVKVTDVPAKWQKAMHGLKIEMAHAGDQKALQKGMKDLTTAQTEFQTAGQAMQTSSELKTVGQKFTEWGASQEAKDMNELNAKFMQSDDGKALIAEWKAFGEAVKEAKKAVVPDKKTMSVTIKNAAIEKIDQKAGDIKKEYEDIQDSAWGIEFDKAMNKAFSNEEAWSLNGAIRDFKNTDEAKNLKKSVHKLGKAVHDNIKITDAPAGWEGLASASSVSLYGDRLARNERVGPAQAQHFITSANNVYRWHVQTDGNTCIAKSYNGWANQVNVWCLNQGVNPAGTVNPFWVHQADGNACVYHNNNRYGTWCTNTAGKLTTTFVMQNDGNACLYWNGKPLWCSGTQGK